MLMSLGAIRKDLVLPYNSLVFAVKKPYCDELWFVINMRKVKGDYLG